MDKKLVLAVAGSGKTTEIINKVNYDDKTIIITYTENNYNNIRNKIIKKYNEIPPNVRIYTYFSFLYRFCFLPLKKNLDVKSIVLGPTTSIMYKINNIYRFQCIIKYKFDNNLDKVLTKILNHYKLDKDINVEIDNNPNKL